MADNMVWNVEIGRSRPPPGLGALATSLIGLAGKWVTPGTGPSTTPGQMRLVSRPFRRPRSPTRASPVQQAVVVLARGLRDKKAGMTRSEIERVFAGVPRLGAYRIRRAPGGVGNRGADDRFECVGFPHRDEATECPLAVRRASMDEDPRHLAFRLDTGVTGEDALTKGPARVPPVQGKPQHHRVGE